MRGSEDTKSTKGHEDKKIRKSRVFDASVLVFLDASVLVFLDELSRKVIGLATQQFRLRKDRGEKHNNIRWIGKQR